MYCGDVLCIDPKSVGSLIRAGGSPTIFQLERETQDLADARLPRRLWMSLCRRFGAACRRK